MTTADFIPPTFAVATIGASIAALRVCAAGVPGARAVPR